mgnify:CR=1 FL=1
MEISDTGLVKPESAAALLGQIHAAMPAITRETGVVLRFLASFRRIPLTIIRDQVQALMRSFGFMAVQTPAGFDHVLGVTVLDAQGRIHGQVLGGRMTAELLGVPLRQLILSAPPAGRLPSLDELIESVSVEEPDVPADLAARINAPGAPGPRLLPVPGEVITELDAIALLTGAKAQLAAAGGVGGAEGSVWLLIDGDPAEEKPQK